MLELFPRLRVAVVGDALLDGFLIGVPARLCRERPVPVVVKRAEREFPGGAANVAANLRALGARPRFVSALGLDDVGRRLGASLSARDVALDGIADAPGARTGHKLRVLADAQYLVRVDVEPSGFDALDVQREIVARLRVAYEACDAVILSDYGGGTIGPAVLRALAELRARRPVPLVVDARDPSRYRAREADVLTPNLEEAAFLAGVRAPDPGDAAALESLARRASEQVRASAVAVTLGAEGVLVARAGEVRRIAGRRVAVDNTCGAGDSFAAVLALALAAGADVAEAARLGLEAAAIAVAKPYTATVSLGELRERLDLLGAEPPPPAPGAADGAVAQVRARAARGARIVLTNGVFDLLHAGHVGLLQRARALGDVLVVALNSDRSAALIKGPNRPITGQAQRRALLEALDCVDEVIVFDGLTAEDVIAAVEPHVYVRGDDWPLADLPEARAAERAGARVVLLPCLGDVTTSRIIERVTARSPHWAPPASLP
jgi:D-beta-D-heptose 7-phosphate kinase/D-beta-D-heptose 1-phosphate adenosyltransferase